MLIKGQTAIVLDTDLSRTWDSNAKKFTPSLTGHGIYVIIAPRRYSNIRETFEAPI